jgi:hypothetical protein
MGWDAENATHYAEVSACLGDLAAHESDPQLKSLLLRMSSDCKTLAAYFLASDEAAGLRCANPGVGETEERLQANREMNALLMKLQKQWEVLAAELDKGVSASLTAFKT